MNTNRPAADGSRTRPGCGDDTWPLAARAAAAFLAVAMAAGCALDAGVRSTGDDTARSAAIGAVADNQIDHRNSRFIGATIGAIASSSAGKYMDAHQRNLEQQLSTERDSRTIRMTRLDLETLRLEIDMAATFEFGSTNVRAGFRDSLTKVAATLEQYGRTAVVVVGHTDDIGTEHYNQQLSERRAISLTRYLVRNGVKRERTRASGLGETQPIDDNATREGRARNRRIEIYLRPVVEGRETEAFEEQD